MLFFVIPAANTYLVGFGALTAALSWLFSGLYYPIIWYKFTDVSEAAGTSETSEHFYKSTLTCNNKTATFKNSFFYMGNYL